MKQEKRIPTIIGLLFLVASIFAGILLTSRNTSFNSKASTSCDPVTLQVTNITNSSANISFTTTDDCLTTLSIDNRTIKDFRFIDQKKAETESKIHYFQISFLKEDTEYDFSLISGGKNYQTDEYQFDTAKKPNSQATSTNLAWGKVYNPDKNPAQEVIVYLNIPGAFPLSALTTSSGNWNIPLSASFNEAGNNWFIPSTNIEENIFVASSKYPVTQIVSNTSNNNPVPDITIGQNNFSAPEVINDTGDLPSIDLSQPTDKELDIYNPKENESLSTKKPEFFGTAPLNSKITIKVESPVTLNGETVVDGSGNWQWEVPQDLTPGEHTITVTAKNEDTGLIETIARTFIVLAAEDNTSFTASPSAEVTPTSSPPTPTPTIKPTSTPIPTIIVENPSTSSGVPTTGVAFPTLIIISMAVLLMSSSFFLNRQK